MVFKAACPEWDFYFFVLFQPLMVKVNIPQHRPFPTSACCTVLLVTKCFIVHQYKAKVAKAECVVGQ
jgi:hypothetical protein